MLSALSVAEFWRNEAAFLAASRRLRASCLCFSAEAEEDVDEESALFSRPSDGRGLPGFFDVGGAAFSSSCGVGVMNHERGREPCVKEKGENTVIGQYDKVISISALNRLYLFRQFW